VIKLNDRGIQRLKREKFLLGCLRCFHHCPTLG
jgi:hypothetical protein